MVEFRGQKGNKHLPHLPVASTGRVNRSYLGVLHERHLVGVASLALAHVHGQLFRPFEERRHVPLPGVFLQESE